VKSVILFDGVCNLCNASVDFVIRNDPTAHFQFAAMQSDAGYQLLKQTGISPDGLAAVVLWEAGQVYTASTAALRIARKLRFPWPLFYVFTLVPPGLRNAVYIWVARNRYRWFGKRDTCRLPNPDERARFLE
jgi:predicted DCC family thiol-disulfide oxidoreductase YuxK